MGDIRPSRRRDRNVRLGAVLPASAEKPGKVKHKTKYKLTPGVAHVYNEGDLHSPSRAGPTRLIRIEGTNMEEAERLKFEPV